MKLFATRVWGFGFARVPLATFNAKGHVARLLRLADRGDRVIFVGTQTQRTGEHERGRILGMAEIGFETLKTMELVERAELDDRDFDAAGRFKFPYAVALTRAWKFEPAPKLLDVVSRQLDMVATSGVQEIDDPADVAAILGLNAVAIELPLLPGLERMRQLNDALRPTTGPRPGKGGTHEVTRTPSDTNWVYGFRYGKHDMFKIGHTIDIDRRLSDINQHIPIELGVDQWSVAFKQKLPTAHAAYDMEQKLLNSMTEHRSGFERVRCKFDYLNSIWSKASSRRSPRSSASAPPVYRSALSASSEHAARQRRRRTRPWPLPARRRSPCG